jgi:hypothetical protein
MKKQLAIVWLISLATFALADDPTLNSIEQAKKAFERQYTLKWAKQQEHDLDLSELFVPLGFSSEKKFAYFIGYNCSESDNKFEGQLEVLDLTDNRVAFEKPYQDDFREDEFHSILDKLGIKSEAAVLRRFPFQKDGDTYTVSVTSTILETDKENAEQKREYQIYLVSEKKGKKLVGKFQVDEYYGKARVQSVVGFFQSPFENRIAILTEGFGGSFEGCTSIIHNVYGASLGSGFKK